MMARTSRARRPSGRGSTRTRTSARTGVIEVLTRPEHSLVARLLGLIVRLRAELTVLVVLLVARCWAWPRIEAWLGHTMALLLTTALILGVLVIPASRRYLSRRWWSMTTRHRMRACYIETRTMTHNGRPPYLLWSRPSPVGEKVRVWLPAGLSVKDLEQVTTETAAACWAADVRVTPSWRQAALVVVDVIRRDPLTGAAITPQVVSDIDDTLGWSDPVVDGASDTDTVGGRTGDTGGTIVPLPFRTVLPPAALAAPGTPGATSQNRAPTRTRRTPAPARDTAGLPDEPPTTGFGGVDVSDYV